jgi:glycosyltransferase involved in cell wall biosynthesis
VRVCYLSLRETLETNLEQLSKCVAAHGYSTTIVNISYHSKNSCYTSDGRRFIFLNLKGWAHPANSIQLRYKKFLFIANAIKLFKKEKFTIIHIDSDCSYYWIIKLFFRKTKLIYHIQSFPISEKKSRLDVYKKIVTTFLQSIFMNAVLIQSSEQKRKWIGTRSLRKTRIVPIGFNDRLLYPIDIQQKKELRKKIGIESNTPILIYSGAIGRHRNLEILISAIDVLKKRYNSTVLLMVGDGDALEKIKSYTQSLNLENNILFTGRVHYREMVKYYGVADIGISYIPVNKNYDYNPPLKTYEYLACGLPCIATKTVSNSMIIKNMENGILVNDSANDIASAIINLMSSKTLFRTIQKNARNSIMHHSFETVARSYLFPIYKNVLN